MTQINWRVVRERREGNGEMVMMVDQDLVVGTKSHLRLVNGRSGMTLMKIKEMARRDLMRLKQHIGVTKITLYRER